MAWYDDAIFYHIYPLGMTGAPKQNPYSEPVHRLNDLLPWIDHIKAIGCNAIYIGPLFESVGHGYETTDYKKLDGRLGTNEDLTRFVARCHSQGIRVILDGVFNHTGRDFFAFQDIRRNRENSPYRDWYCHVNFGGDNSFHDGFSYENWGGYDLLAKLNQHNSAVREYICDVICFWVREFDIDGIRLDAADVMDPDYMKALRRTANEVKEDFWLMGEVIHGDYSRWVNNETLHSVTNYMLHKALYSGLNDHNFFEIAHTIKHVTGLVGDCRKLYTFADNHDVERIYTKLNNKAHLTPLYIMLYTLPGIPALYYGSEFAMEGRKERFSDDSLRPALRWEDYKEAAQSNPCTVLLSALGRIRRGNAALSRGEYRELLLTTQHFAYARTLCGKSVVITVNNSDQDTEMTLPADTCGVYTGALFGAQVSAQDGKIRVKVGANSGEIWIAGDSDSDLTAASLPEETASAIQAPTPAPTPEPVPAPAPAPTPAPECVHETQPQASPAASNPPAAQNKPYEEMSIEELQAAILACMAKNGPVTEYMLGTVYENRHHGSLLNWVRSFR